MTDFAADRQPGPALSPDAIEIWDTHELDGEIWDTHELDGEIWDTHELDGIQEEEIWDTLY